MGRWELGARGLGNTEGLGVYVCLEYEPGMGAAWGGPWVQGETGWEGGGSRAAAAHLADGI